MSEEGNKYLEFRDNMRDYIPLMLKHPNKFVAIDFRMVMDYWLSFLKIKQYMPPETKDSNICFDYTSVFMRKDSHLAKGVNRW